MGKVSVDRPLALDKLVDAPRGNAYIIRQTRHADGAGSEKFL
jgi:hypothetical protein